MKKLLFLLLIVAAGLGLGGGAAFGTMLLLGPHPAGSVSAAPGDPAFVPVERVLAPLVYPDGRLAGYTQFQLQLEVTEDRVAFVTARLPLLLHAINMRTYRTPLAAGPDGQLPNVEEFRKVAMTAASEAFGPGVVRKVAITQAAPA